MNKTGLRIILISFFIILFSGSFFVVLAVEENNRLAKNQAAQEQFLSDVKALDQARQVYLNSIAESRTTSKADMAAAKAQYEALLKNQPSLIQQNQKQTTVAVSQLVPVANSSNVSAAQTAKPAVTRKTKTS